jgi:phosphatidylinositol glycan class C protein
MTVTLFLLATLTLSTISRTVLVMYLLCAIFVTFACPFWLIWLQRYKNEIHGPWDEARLVLSTSTMNGLFSTTKTQPTYRT